MRKNRDFVPGLVLAGLLGLGIWGASWTAEAEQRPPSEKKYSVEAFSQELTIRIECSGVCDLATMKAEAREAVAR